MRTQLWRPVTVFAKRNDLLHEVSSDGGTKIIKIDFAPIVVRVPEPVIELRASGSFEYFYFTTYCDDSLRMIMTNKGLIIITGGSRGIGAATALLAAERGYHVLITYLERADAAEGVVQQIREKGGEALAVQGDVAVEADILRIFQTADRQPRPLTALVNNAGILRQRRVADITTESLQALFAANVFGTFICSREAIKRMARTRGGQGGGIVNVSSMASRHGSPNEYVDYASTKGAVDTFTMGLAKEVAADGIRVNAVRPGLIHTDIHAAGGEPGRIDRLKNTIPLGRGGYPQEVAEAIIWLLSDASSFCTGTFIDISGGR